MAGQVRLEIEEVSGVADPSNKAQIGGVTGFLSRPVRKSADEARAEELIKSRDESDVLIFNGALTGPMVLFKKREPEPITLTDAEEIAKTALALAREEVRAERAARQRERDYAWVSKLRVSQKPDRDGAAGQGWFVVDEDGCTIDENAYPTREDAEEALAERVEETAA